MKAKRGDAGYAGKETRPKSLIQRGSDFPEARKQKEGDRNHV